MIPGYTNVKEIYRGKKRVIFRGLREKDNRPVIIKTFNDEFP